MIYTGIGARKIPAHIRNRMLQLGRVLAENGYTLRSGAADGADAAFEEGCDMVGGQKEIFLPWQGFNNHSSELYEPPKQAYTLAEEYHPWFDKLGPAEENFHARNVQQVLGELLYEPSDFVVCWTQDGCESDATRSRVTGGTGQAISVASLRDIPVFNLKNKGSLERLVEFVEEME